MGEQTVYVLGKASSQQQGIAVKVSRESKVIHDFQLGGGLASLTSALFKSQLYYLWHDFQHVSGENSRVEKNVLSYAITKSKKDSEYKYIMYIYFFSGKR